MPGLDERPVARARGSLAGLLPWAAVILLPGLAGAIAASRGAREPAASSCVPATAPTPLESAAPDEALTHLAEEVARRRGLPWRAPVRIRAPQRESRTASLHAAEAVGAVGGAQGLLIRTGPRDELGRELPAWYDFESKVVYVREGASDARLRSLLSHELVHALEDQHLDLSKRLARCRTPQERYCLRCVIEGVAEEIRAQVDSKYVEDSPLGGARVAASDMPSDPASGAVATVEAIRSIAPYVLGRDFIARATGGDSLRIDAIYTSPPRTQEEILHPSTYSTGPMPPPTRFVWDGGRDVHWTAPEEIGEFDFALRLHRLSTERPTPGFELSFVKLVSARAFRAASGWDGMERRELVRQGRLEGWALVSHWDTAEDACEAERALGDATRTSDDESRGSGASADGTATPGGASSAAVSTGRTLRAWWGADATAAAECRRMALDVVVIAHQNPPRPHDMAPTLAWTDRSARVTLPALPQWSSGQEPGRLRCTEHALELRLFTSLDSPAIVLPRWIADARGLDEVSARTGLDLQSTRVAGRPAVRATVWQGTGLSLMRHEAWVVDLRDGGALVVHFTGSEGSWSRGSDARRAVLSSLAVTD